MRRGHYASLEWRSSRYAARPGGRRQRRQALIHQLPVKIMEEYRCYFLNNAGTIVDFEQLMCIDDERAWQRAMVLLTKRPRYHAIELWSFGRKIVQHTH